MLATRRVSTRHGSGAGRTAVPFRDMSVMASPLTHPLSPLGEEEVVAAVAAVKADSRWRDSMRFASCVTDEPPKAAVLGWPATPVVRRAALIVVDRETGVSADVAVALDSGTVESWTVNASHAHYLLEEFMDAVSVVKADAGWQAALRARGVESFDLVQCDPWPAGNFGLPGEEGKRLARVVSYVRDFDADNGYAHPIEGVVATVDLVAKKVLRLEDHGAVPIPREPGNYGVAATGTPRADLRPLAITQPDGPSFMVEGDAITWQRWRLRVSMHPVDGLVLHQVGYEDPAQGGRVRPVLYRAALGEMVVPYGETAPNHRWKNAFDSGELGLGRFPFVNSLVLGCDCLGEIRYLDLVQVTETGEPLRLPNVVCVHEEDYGILWKHQDLNTFTTEVRRSRRLVVSSIHTVGNYEYGFYWYFYLDGTIQLEAKLTGIMQTMAVAPGEVPVHGALVAPQLAAPNHQHLFCFRLDLDVDGEANSVYECELRAAPADGEGNDYGNAMVNVAEPLETELGARRLADATRARTWKVVNPARTNRLGQPVGYRLLPGLAPTLLAGPDTSIGRRAAFARYNLWVTPYEPAERRAAGDPVCNPGGDGLPAWTAADRPVIDTDVVLWYSFGVNHAPRAEDWPVMPVEYAGFTLSPFGFFDRNPGLDVPAPDHCTPS
jgi:primary-amine oxidase